MNTKLRRTWETLEARQLLAADLSVRFEPLPAEANATEPLSYVAHVRNEGPDDAVGVQVEIGGMPLEAAAWTRQGPNQFPVDLALQHLDGTNGVFFEDFRLTSIGDLNGDGLSDFVRVAHKVPFVLFGSAQLSASSTADPQMFDGQAGFRLTGFDDYAQGANAGDVNGDGIDDLLFGAHIVFGGANVGAGGEVRAEDAWRVSARDCRTHCRGRNPVNHAAAGDLNGDGFDDLVVSDPTRPHTDDEQDTGSVVIVWGGPSTSRQSVNFAEITESDGLHIRPDTQEPWEFGEELASLGDINQDGFDDLLILDHIRSIAGEHETTIYLVMGKAELEQTHELVIDPIDGADGVTRLVHRRMHPVLSNLLHNLELTTRLIDLNNDGHQDLFLDNMVIQGGPDGFAFERAVPDEFGVIDIAKLDGVEPFMPGRWWPVDFGDLNHDGELDLVLRDTNDRLFDDGVEKNGAVYISFGNGSERPFGLDIGEYDGQTGTRILGWEPDVEIGAAGDVIEDVNGDGIDDLLVRGGREPGTHLVFGSQNYRSARRGAVHDLIDIPAGGEISYTVTGHLPTESPGQVQATATVTAVNDTLPANNVAVSNAVTVNGATAAKQTDLTVTLATSHSTVFPGQRANYTVTVTNSSDTFAALAKVRVQLDESLSDVTWTRMDTGQQGVGDIQKIIDVPPGVELIYEIAYTVGRKVGALTSMATVEAGQHQSDSNPSDNSVVHTSQAPLRPQYPTDLGNSTPCYEDTAIAGGNLFYVGVSRDRCFSNRAQASSGFFGGHLWKTDGTRGGTQLVRLFLPELLDRPEPVDGIKDPDLTEFQGVAYFAADDVSSGQELWRSDGTEAGTYVVKDINSQWLTETGKFGTVREVNQSADVDNLGALTDYLLFSADDGSHGRELWRTDGTEAGTVLVKDINSGDADGFERDAWYQEAERSIVYQDVYYFLADDGVHGLELWRSDGTSVGTYMVKDIAPGGDSAFAARIERWWESSPLKQPRFQIHDGLLYFYEHSTNSKGALWRTDGTADGTQPASVKLPAVDDRFVVGDTVVTYDDGAFYGEPVDGGPRRLLAIWHDNSRMEPTWMRGLGDLVVFSVRQSTLDETAFTYSFSTKLERVQILDPGLLQLTSETTPQLRTASEVRDIQELDDEALEDVYELHRVTLGYRLDSQTEYHGGMASPTEVLGANGTAIGLLHGESITLGFSGSVVDGPGVDISLSLLYGWDRLQVDGIDSSGKVYDLGSLNHEKNDIDLAELGLGDVQLDAIRLAVEDRPTWGEPIYFDTVFARTDAEVVLTASSPLRPDLQFSWDLNNDGVFGDRVGRSIGLTRADLAQFGMVQAGAYPVRVRMNDRVADYYDEAIMQIAGEFTADVDGDQQLTFADFLLLRENYGIADAAKTDGDLDNDGRVTFRDFLILSSHFRFIEP